jgi:hypothetical protein
MKKGKLGAVFILVPVDPVGFGDYVPTHATLE